jgi:hypothetical protein
MRWEEANRSLWPNSEVHEESLPAMPVLLFSRVQNNHNTTAVRFAMGIDEDTTDEGESVRKRTEKSTDEQRRAVAQIERRLICTNLAIHRIGSTSANADHKLSR